MVVELCPYFDIQCGWAMIKKMFIRAAIKNFDKKNMLFTCTGIIVGILGITVARAQSSEIIQACIAQSNGDSQCKNLAGNANTGSVRIVQNQDDCRNDETYITWNVQGPQGLPGPAGVPGPQGPPGESSGPFICMLCSIRDFLYRLNRTDLINVNFNDAILNGQLPNENLSGSTFIHAIVRLNITGANLSGTDLSFANMDGDSAAYANFTGSNMNGVSIPYADLTGAIFTNTNLTGVTGLDSSTLDNVVWSNTICPDGTGSNDHGGTCLGHLVP